MMVGTLNQLLMQAGLVGGHPCLLLAGDGSWLPTFGQPHALLWPFQSHCTRMSAFSRLSDWQPYLGVFIHGHMIAGSGYWKGSVLLWADVWPPPKGTFTWGLACCTLGLFSGQFLRWS